MFIIKRTRDTFIDPVRARCAIGRKVATRVTRGDVCIMHSQVSASRVYFNSRILREALLSNPELVKEVLGLTITDATKEVVEPVAKPVTEPTEEVVTGSVKELKELGKSELLEIAKRKGLKVNTKTTKATLIELIEFEQL